MIEGTTFPKNLAAAPVFTPWHVPPVSEIDASASLPWDKTWGDLLNKGSGSAAATWKLRPRRGSSDPSRAIAIALRINTSPFCLDFAFAASLC